MPHVEPYGVPLKSAISLKETFLFNCNSVLKNRNVLRTQQIGTDCLKSSINIYVKTFC